MNVHAINGYMDGYLQKTAGWNPFAWEPGSDEKVKAALGNYGKKVVAGVGPDLMKATQPFRQQAAEEGGRDAARGAMGEVRTSLGQLWNQNQGKFGMGLGALGLAYAAPMVMSGMQNNAILNQLQAMQGMQGGGGGKSPVSTTGRVKAPWELDPQAFRFSAAQRSGIQQSQQNYFRTAMQKAMAKQQAEASTRAATAASVAQANPAQPTGFAGEPMHSGRPVPAM